MKRWVARATQSGNGSRGTGRSRLTAPTNVTLGALVTATHDPTTCSRCLNQSPMFTLRGERAPSLSCREITNDMINVANQIFNDSI